MYISPYDTIYCTIYRASLLHVSKWHVSEMHLHNLVHICRHDAWGQFGLYMYIVFLSPILTFEFDASPENSQNSRKKPTHIPTGHLP